MRNIIHYFKYSIKFYKSKLAIKKMAFRFNLSYLLQNRRLPRKRPKSECDEFKKYLDAHKSNRG